MEDWDWVTISALATATGTRPATGSTTLRDLAGELSPRLEGASIEMPILLASHSIGGGVTQFFADRGPDDRRQDRYASRTEPG